MGPATSDPAASRTSREQRITIVEVLGYTGTAVALLGTGAVVGSFTGGGRAVTAIASLLVAVALLATGMVVGGASHERLQRMRSVLWFLSVGAFQAFLAALIEPSGKAGAFVVLLLTGVAAGALWWVLRRTLQQLALYGSVLGAVLVLVVPDAGFGVIGLVVGGIPDLVITAIATMVVGTAWLVLGYLGLVAPPRTAMVLGSLTVLIATLILSADAQEGAFLVMTIVGAGLLLVGALRSDRAVGGIGIVGLLLGTALFFGEVLPGGAGSIIALLIGVGILVAMLLLARSWGAVPTELPSLRGLLSSPAPPTPPPLTPPPPPPPVQGDSSPSG